MSENRQADGYTAGVLLTQTPEDDPPPCEQPSDDLIFLLLIFLPLIFLLLCTCTNGVADHSCDLPQLTLHK
jgi:hypothetical protein